MTAARETLTLNNPYPPKVHAVLLNVCGRISRRADASTGEGREQQTPVGAGSLNRARSFERSDEARNVVRSEATAAADCVGPLFGPLDGGRCKVCG